MKRIAFIIGLASAFVAQLAYAADTNQCIIKDGQEYCPTQKMPETQPEIQQQTPVPPQAPPQPQYYQPAPAPQVILPQPPLVYVQERCLWPGYWWAVNGHWYCVYPAGPVFYGPGFYLGLGGFFEFRLNVGRVWHYGDGGRWNLGAVPRAYVGERRERVNNDYRRGNNAVRNNGVGNRDYRRDNLVRNDSRVTPPARNDYRGNVGAGSRTSAPRGNVNGGHAGGAHHGR